MSGDNFPFHTIPEGNFSRSRLHLHGIIRPEGAISLHEGLRALGLCKSRLQQEAKICTRHNKEHFRHSLIPRMTLKVVRSFLAA